VDKTMVSCWSSNSSIAASFSLMKHTCRSTPLCPNSHSLNWIPSQDSLSFKLK
jgi:hypothetical protein